MSVTNFARYGTIAAPDWAVRQRQKNRAVDRKARLRDLKGYREARDASKAIVRFDQSTFAGLTRAALKGIGGPSSFWALTSLDAYQDGAECCVRISRETARQWAAWMRQPGHDVPHDILDRLDEIACRPEPIST